VVNPVCSHCLYALWLDHSVLTALLYNMYSSSKQFEYKFMHYALIPNLHHCLKRRRHDEALK